MPALDQDRRVHLLGHDEVTRPRVPPVSLQQERALVAAGRQPGAVIEDTAIAAVGRVPGEIARTKRSVSLPGNSASGSSWLKTRTAWSRRSRPEWPPPVTRRPSAKPGEPFQSPAWIEAPRYVILSQSWTAPQQSGIATLVAAAAPVRSKWLIRLRPSAARSPGGPDLAAFVLPRRPA